MVGQFSLLFKFPLSPVWVILVLFSMCLVTDRKTLAWYNQQFSKSINEELWNKKIHGNKKDWWRWEEKEELNVLGINQWRCFTKVKFGMLTGVSNSFKEWVKANSSHCFSPPQEKISDTIHKKASVIAWKWLMKPSFNTPQTATFFFGSLIILKNEVELVTWDLTTNLTREKELV